jgi:long-subunit acyl-CoA synthetase (AMP-forming)
MIEVVEYFKQILGIELTTSDEACSNPKVIALIDECVKRTNLKLVSRAAHIRKVLLLPTDFSAQGGELTPTLKLRRKVTEQKYQAQINQLFQAVKL